MLILGEVVIRTVMKMIWVIHLGLDSLCIGLKDWYTIGYPCTFNTEGLLVTWSRVEEKFSKSYLGGVFSEIDLVH